MKNVTTAYGAVFDFALSSLLTYGLVRKVSEEGKEYLELTDLGKSALSGLFYMGPPYVRPGLWYGGRRHHHGWWW